jgi:hypothetical protein
MNAKTILATIGVVAFLGLGLYLGIAQGVEPGLPTCSKYTLICRP